MVTMVVAAFKAVTDMRQPLVYHHIIVEGLTLTILLCSYGAVNKQLVTLRHNLNHSGHNRRCGI